ncbi:hypothetical protein KUV51_11540 [Tateyamaria omphalii]|uniref:MotE family protein n=1 Tax=Tateyamaria omphalii TaxID=299262 RepID=UPI001C9961E9|nr:hypothetical protein [Tateyamaria omphalii]MBY5933634.1 hypothetical protein [Tateyamaria omphalii]
MKKHRPSRFSNRGSVALLIILLVGSAAVRIGTSANSALAEVDLAEGFSLPLSTVSASATPQVSDEVNIQSLLDALRAREKNVVKREGVLAARSKALDVAQIEIERRLEALEDAEQRLRATLSIAQTAAEDDLTRLTAVYENMKPKDAAALFEAMEPAFAAGFMGRMEPTVAAKILAGLDPQVAYSISAILAGRNAQAPKN